MILIFGLIVSSSAVCFALSEDQYAQMAADNVLIMYEHKGDSQAVIQATADYLKKFSEEDIKEYVSMARQIMQDQELAKRIAQKVIDILTKEGYKISLGSGADLNSITIEK